MNARAGDGRSTDDGPAVANAACTTAFAAALAASGVRDVCISPGSRSSPLALALYARPDLRCRVAIDERSAAFVALGTARVTRRPVVVVATSGSAPAHWHPAVVEADEAGVPLILCSTDRPPELHGRGAAQTTTQTGMFAAAVRCAIETGTPGPEPAGPSWFRHVACRAVDAARGGDGTPGPVHVNMALREPLVPAVWPAPEPSPADATAPGFASVHRAGAVPEIPTDVTDRLHTGRGLIACGPLPAADDPRDVAQAVALLAEVTGWPVVAEAASGLRCGAAHATNVAHTALFVDDADIAATLRPDAVVRVGAWPIARSVQTFLADTAPHVLVAEHGWPDPRGTAAQLLRAPTRAALVALADVLQRSGDAADPAWRTAWHDADAAVADLLDGWCAREELSEPAACRIAAGAAVDAGAVLHVAASMPLRDVDAVLPARREPLDVLASRGVNGIDGTIATAVGIASAGPVVTVLGDVAFAHDVGSLALVGTDTPVTVVVIDNGGGGIFSFLPQAAADLSSAGDDAFEALFTTPPAVDISAACAAAGVAHATAGSPDELRDALSGTGSASPRVVQVHCPAPDVNAAAHEQLRSAAAAAARTALARS